MSPEEREFIKSVDNVILSASAKTLKQLQELDVKTQLDGNSFYEEYATSLESKKEKPIFKTKPFSKNKPY